MLELMKIFLTKVKRHIQMVEDDLHYHKIQDCDKTLVHMKLCKLYQIYDDIEDYIKWYYSNLK